MKPAMRPEAGHTGDVTTTGTSGLPVPAPPSRHCSPAPGRRAAAMRTRTSPSTMARAAPAAARAAAAAVRVEGVPAKAPEPPAVSGIERALIVQFAEMARAVGVLDNADYKVECRNSGPVAAVSCRAGAREPLAGCHGGGPSGGGPAALPLRPCEQVAQCRPDTWHGADAGGARRAGDPGFRARDRLSLRQARQAGHHKALAWGAAAGARQLP